MDFYGVIVVGIIMLVLAAGAIIESSAKRRARRKEYALIRQGRREVLDWMREVTP